MNLLTNYQLGQSPQTVKMMETQNFSKYEVQWTPDKIFEMVGDRMNNGTSDSIKDKEELWCEEVPSDEWTGNLPINRWNFVIVHKDEGISVSRIKTYDPETGEMTLHWLNPNVPDETRNIKEVDELYIVVQTRWTPIMKQSLPKMKHFKRNMTMKIEILNPDLTEVLTGIESLSSKMDDLDKIYPIDNPHRLNYVAACNAVVRAKFYLSALNTISRSTDQRPVLQD